MRAKLTLLSAFVVGIVGGAIASGCQTYDFEPVEPLAIAQTTVGDVIKARSQKPNMMVLLDTSGSMTLPVDTSLAACQLPSGGGVCGNTPSTPCPVNTCPTRWTELQAAMSRFLDDSGSAVRLGLTTYPGAAQPNSLRCESSSEVRISVPQVDDADTASLQSAADQIQAVIQGIPNSGPNQPSGGTPTSLSLNFVGGVGTLQTTERQDFVLLLTDGLPNCNPSNPNGGGDVAACRCTINRCQGDYTQLGCLDKDASVTAVTELGKKGIQTIVIGFGAETASGAGPETLNAMAQAGGFARKCTDENPNACGAGDTCDPVTKLCGRAFYQAANQAELSQALDAIINLVGNRNICLLELAPAQRPTDDSLIVVYVNDVPTPGGSDTWTLTDEGVLFQGSTCERIRASTDANPIKVEARAVQRK
ncbi:adventurous gliding motility lipoprotein CglB [Hyalangium rubrum]|uniref:Adventurous gliding motility lipoprotein CglB n=1 Tax=Hyalangium rubrum TaxID=3103134 RepID=A0ABU5HBQ4_9BACT|nr:adventurous gliding motility lipoprotein CglB [Hyalangium sp. s54d21]MDY7230903.1 adventurous gliding motility lipoprotein CglB [Hyalangium sp. s54d21]